VLGYPVNDLSIKPVTGDGVVAQCYTLSVKSDYPNSLRSVFAKYYVERSEVWRKRLFWLMAGSLEYLGGKEVYYYTHIRPFMDANGIRSPKPYYIGMEDYGKRSPLLFLLGFKSQFRLLFLFEDLSDYKTFGYVGSLPEEYASASMKKLAQLHALNWNTKRFDPTLQAQTYDFFFNFHPNFITKFPERDRLSKILDTWEKQFPLLAQPDIRSALYTYSEHYPDLSKKYFHPNVMDSGSLFKNYTLLHGDFHCGNIFYQVDASNEDPVQDVVILDWQNYGYGHPSTEVAFLMSFSNADEEKESRLKKIYYDELTKTVPREEYPFQVFERELEIRKMGLEANVIPMISMQGNPEDVKKMMEEFDLGVDVEQTHKRMIQNLVRFSETVEKWNTKNIWANPDHTQE